MGDKAAAAAKSSPEQKGDHDGRQACETNGDHKGRQVKLGRQGGSGSQEQPRMEIMKGDKLGRQGVGADLVKGDKLGRQGGSGIMTVW